MSKQFTGRKLRPNHSNALPRYIVAYATETRDRPNLNRPGHYTRVFTAGASVACRLVDLKPTAVKPRLIHNPLELWEQIERLSAANHTLWVVGHSVLFDLLVSDMPQQFEETKLVVDWPRSKRKRESNSPDDPHSSAVVVISNPPVIVACRCVASGGRVVFVDLLNWFSSPIDDIAEMERADRSELGERAEIPSEMDTPAMRKADLVFRTFLRLIRWSRTNDMGMFRYTAASQAMAAYRHRFMPRTIYMHDNKDAKRMERESYVGGRTELFKSGKFAGRAYQLDVSSLFPAVMRDGFFPHKLVSFTPRKAYSVELPTIDYSSAVARVRVKTRRPIYPLRASFGTIYPIGEFNTILCGLELDSAKEAGELVSVESYAEYETSPLFGEWVSELWAMRKNHSDRGETVYARLVKNLLNSLYGKFAQKSSEWLNLPTSVSSVPWAEWSCVNAVTSERTRLRSFGWQTQQFIGGGEMENTFVAISAFITSAARMRMNRLRTVAGERCVYYQGVDSLIVTQAGLDRLTGAGEVAEGELGKLRIQYVADDGELRGYCDYRLGDKTTKSGLPGRHWIGSDGELLTQLSQVQRSLFPGRPVDGVSIVDTPWTRNYLTPKGVEDSEGWVWPYQIPSDPSYPVGEARAAV